MKKIIFALSLMLFSSLSQALLITANASVDENKTFKKDFTTSILIPWEQETHLWLLQKTINYTQAT